jgi:hypothetical protein
MTEKALYVSFHPEEYRNEKASVLKMQIDILNLEKRVRNLKKIRKEKNSQKVILKNSISRLNKDLEKMDRYWPEPKVPRAIKRKKEESYAKMEKGEVRDKNEIDSELMEIQRKLEALNS